jgi:hypothetical protein
MATTEEQPAAKAAGYQFEGTLLEVCSCDVLCPCWIGEDPDQGTCDAVVAYHFDKGAIRGVDVSGLSFVAVAHIPGNILEGNWRAVFYLDDQADEEQGDAILDAFTGKLGGPLADIAELVGEVVGVERASITHEIDEGAGTLKIGNKVDCAMHPYTGPDGSPTKLVDSIFTTVPGSPAYVSVADHEKVDIPEHGYSWEYEKKNAIQSDWKLDFAGE